MESQNHTEENRIRQQRRRTSMNTEQRQEYLTRRRASYQATRALNFCCLNGRVSLPLMPVPLELLSIYNDETEVGRQFRQHIFMYNHIFTFTSMGVHLYGNLANGREGVYSFLAQGSIYHKIGGFLPSSSERPRFLQLYFYDTDNEINNRVTENPTLNVELVERLRSILDVHNPFVHRFRQLTQEPNIENCQHIIREQPHNRPQYNLPTRYEVAAIIVGGEEVGQLNERDIIVQSHSGHLMNVSDTAGYYDPLQYPLIFPCGTYGWDVKIQNGAASRTKVTCRDYYSYMLQIRDGWDNLLLRGCHLLQQYAVEIFLKMETQKFRWVRNNQSKIRVEMYNGLQDSFEAGINISGDDDKLNAPDVYNQVVKAEIPLQSDQPKLYTFVLKHIIHGPCGTINPRSPCMQKDLIDDLEGNNDVPKCIEDELIIQVSDTDMQLIDLLNDDQKGGTGKTFLYRALLSSVRKKRMIALATASSGITATILPGVDDDARNLYQQEFWNSISPSGMSPHVLRLKKGVPIMLLRNVDPKAGLCNGTRLICRDFLPNVIDAEIFTGQIKGDREFIPRISLKPTKGAHLPFQMTRRQFPIHLSFALTINKSQGQTIPSVGVYLPDHVFSHGQLDVALSRGTSMETVKVLVKKGHLRGEHQTCTRNVVYKDVLLNV
ncbi:uncharacterized protein G2W53_007517 [Senna tora]|uniref:ATP-dependent DNA helicase n=1 Tax=Senna tora TaxID=362788 RepID=A0A834X6T9_9FABA|nr:uncharacterized protein G2W53_007517 [Senna tora]